MGGDGNSSGAAPAPGLGIHGVDRRLARLRSLPARLRPAARWPLRRLGLRRAEPPVPYRSLVESAADAILTVDASASVLSCNRAGAALTGWSAEEMVGRNALELLLDPHEAARVRSRVGATLDEDGAVMEPIRTEVRRRDGEACPAEFTVSRLVHDDGDVHLVIVRDVTERRRIEVELTHQALHDPLTGLANRALLIDRLSAALHRAERTRRWPSLLFIDLDRFKAINDSLGHEVGDELLAVIAHRLSAELRASDTAARLGGDEFIALCEDLDAEQAGQLARRLLDALGRPIDLPRTAAIVTASIGVVMAEPGATPETLLRDADASMYRAKADGRNRYRLFDESIRAATMSRLSIESGLRRALTHDELDLWFQPQFSVVDLQPVGAEALLRWRHPDEGLVAPDRFIDVAVEVGLDREVDEWVLRSSARAAHRWSRRNPEFVVWVNLSARTLTDPGAADLVLCALREAGVGPANVGIEVTERALLVDLDLAAESLGRLRAAGAHIAIDDFGTGFSSLAWLERLPIDVLKIDRSFTQRLDSSGDDTGVARSVVAMAHNLGLTALAEGVETLHQLDQLRDLGCDQAQGYLLSRPAPAADVDPTERPELAAARPVPAGTSRPVGPDPVPV